MEGDVSEVGEEGGLMLMLMPCVLIGGFAWVVVVGAGSGERRDARGRRETKKSKTNESKRCWWFFKCF